MKEIISFKNGSRFCFSVKENNLRDFYKKAIEINEYKNIESDTLIELRLDYLVNKKCDLKELIETVNKLKKQTKDRQYIATLRNFQSGGNCLVDAKEYFEIVSEIYKNTKVDGIDIDYDMYQKKSKLYDKLFDKKKTVILSFINKVDKFSREEYVDLYKKMLKTSANGIKVVTKAISFLDMENLMESAKDSKDLFEANNKFIIVISTGRLGLTSRVHYEYTNTKIIYLDAYPFNPIPDGEIDREHFDKCRKQMK